MTIKNKLAALKEKLDAIIHHDGGLDYWLARELMKALGYTSWQNFTKVLRRAMESCQTLAVPVRDHFNEVVKMVPLGSGSEREVQDYELTRYACYLIAQNGDTKKEQIAFAQAYFAVQTRKQELIEERMEHIKRLDAREKLSEAEKLLSQNIYERGVDEAGFGYIRSKGDEALFGGHDTQDMKRRLGVKGKRPLADFLPTVTIAAKNLATELTNYNVENKDLRGRQPIADEHVQNNTAVRHVLGERGIKPEELPPSEDIKKLERRGKSQEKKLIEQSGSFAAKAE